jgi:hypothetical protein
MKKLYLIFFFSILVVFSIRAQDLLIGDFENGIGGWTTWGAPLSTESNPDMVGNTSTTVALLNQTAAAWSGMVLWNDPSIITVAFEKISLDVYIENTGGKIKLQLDNSASGAANFESEVTVLANTWTTVEFNISAITAHDYKQIAFQSDVADMIYFDNIKLIAIPVIVTDPNTYALKNFLIGTEAPDPKDFSASVNAKWDADSLYIMVDITDDILNNSAPNAWERDLVEIYFDLDNSKQDGAYDANDKEMSFIWNTDNSALLNGKAKSVQENTETGWKIKITVPFSAIMPGFIPEIGKSIGFDVHVDDNDGLPTRDTKLAWMAYEDKAWENTSYMGTIKFLADSLVEPIYPVKPYSLSNYLIGSAPTNAADFSAILRTTWDTANIYISVEITDNILTKAAPNAWERDMVEIYFDLDNSKQNGPYDTNDKDLSFIWNTDNSGQLNGKAISEQVTTATGWQLKVTVPFSAIIPGYIPEIDKLIGFDVHVDDNDGAAARIRKLSWMALEDKAWQNTSYMGTIKLLANGQVEPIYPVPPVIENNMIFVHPGAVNSKADLDFVKEMIAAGKQPWTKAFNQMKGMAKGGSNPMEWIDSHDDAGDAAISKDDALKTYANALTWYFTGQEIYAKQAIALLNAWTILQGFNNGTDQDKLHAGWIGSLFGPAAEIMRDYPGWAPQDIAKVQQMFRRAYYPQLKTASTWNGNVDLAQIEALMNIAVFNEDSLEFYQGINRLRLRNPAYFYLADDLGSKRNYGGSSYPGSWSSPTRWVDGITQETCRDNNHHAQFALASAIHAAEVAWNQGIDIYTENTERYTAAMELMATQFLTGKMQGTCSDNNTTTNIFDTWEMGYYHYHHRKGLGLPNSEKMIKDIVRVKASSQLNIFYETLTHGDPSIFLTDINQLSQNTEISIFPNPSNNGLFQFNREVQWEVFNTIGIKVKEGYGNELNLSNQTKGLYLVKAENCVIKIIIN